MQKKEAACGYQVLFKSFGLCDPGVEHSDTFVQGQTNQRGLQTWTVAGLHISVKIRDIKKAVKKNLPKEPKKKGDDEADAIDVE